MTLVVFAIHTLCEFVHCVFVCVSTVECFGTCDLPGAFVGWFIILAQFALNLKKTPKKPSDYALDSGIVRQGEIAWE